MPKIDLALAGGDYAPVAERITLFYERYPDGRIITELVARDEREVTFRAAVYRSTADREPAATGWAAEREGDGDINTVACLENTETSAIGRALANLGFTASAQRPSMEEMARASARRAAAGARSARQPRGEAAPGAAHPAAAGHFPAPPSAAGRAARVAERRPAAAATSPPPPPSVDPDARPAAADAPIRADVLALVESAAREGLRPSRVAAVRELAGRAGATPAQLEEVERSLRGWLTRRAAS